MEKPLPQIFCFATNEWDTPWWMARQHLFTRLAARGWPVVYSTGVQSLWLRHQPKWKRSGLLHSSKTVSGAESAPLVVDRAGRLQAVWPRSAAWSRMAMRAHAKHLLRSAPELAGRKRIAYLWNPSFWPYVDLIKADYVVFHMHDAYDLLGWSDAAQWRMEQLVDRADMIIAVADNMANRLPFDGPERARILPHGVDYKAILAGADANCPSDLDAIPQPRIGYVGRLNLKIDLEGLAEVAEQRPHWHWVIIGSVGVGSTQSFESDPETFAAWQRIQKCQNVHFLGVKPRQEVPAYLQHLDVLTLFYRFDDSGYWVAGYPTKLHEYLAAGKPVVSSNLENVRPFTDVVRIASTPDDWIEAIDEALINGGQGTPQMRKIVAQKGDWDHRTDTLERWLYELMG